jgi:hypothetical protein
MSSRRSRLTFGVIKKDAIARFGANLRYCTAEMKARTRRFGSNRPQTRLARLMLRSGRHDWPCFRLAATPGRISTKMAASN